MSDILKVIRGVLACASIKVIVDGTVRRPSAAGDGQWGSGKRRRRWKVQAGRALLSN
jgi:hypothetical protein